jgi:hypothetical protein
LPVAAYAAFKSAIARGDAALASRRPRVSAHPARNCIHCAQEAGERAKINTIDQILSNRCRRAITARVGAKKSDDWFGVRL